MKRALAVSLLAAAGIATLTATGAHADGPAYYTRYTTLTLTAGVNDTFSNRANVEVDCDDSDASTGGGYDIQSGAGGLSITSDTVSGSAWNGWEVGGFTTGTANATITAWVVCVVGASDAGINQP